MGEIAIMGIGAFFIIVLSFWLAVKPKWVEENGAKFFLLMILLIVVELGTAVWRLPKEFRSSIIPKLQRQISNYDSLTEDIGKWRKEMEIYNQKHDKWINQNEKRIDLLSEIEKQRIWSLIPDLGLKKGSHFDGVQRIPVQTFYDADEFTQYK